MAARLTASSYAILGMLTLRPWSAYELAEQARRSLRFVWPKSASHLYAEPKKLVQLGLATVRTEAGGGKSRSRHVYGITAEGREAFQRWLATEPAPPQLEAEIMLRVFFADQGDKDQLLAALDVFEAQVRQVLAEGIVQMENVAAGNMLYPGRMHLIALYASFQGDYYRLMLDWVALARQEIATWDGTADVGLTERTRHLVDMAAAGRSVL